MSLGNYQKNIKIFYPIFWGFLLLGLMSCTKKEPQAAPIYFSKENCHHCKMTIMDKRFGGELVNEHGKVFKFDSLECLSKARSSLDPHHAFQVFAIDSYDEGHLVPVGQLKFMIHKTLKSPMGRGILASMDEKKLPLQDAIPVGERKASSFSWDELEIELKKEISHP